MATPIASHPETLHTIIALTVVSLTSLEGMVSFAVGRRLQVALPYLISAAAGALIGTAFAHFLPEAIQEVGAGRKLTLLLLVGLLGSFLLERLLRVFFRRIYGTHRRIKNHKQSTLFIMAMSTNGPQASH